MADDRFFKREPSLTLQQIAELSGASLAPGADPSILIEDVAPLDVAGAQHVSFLDNIKYREQFSNTKAAACFVSPVMAGKAPAGVACLVSDKPYKSYARTAQAFYPLPAFEAGVAEGAYVHESASIGSGSRIEHGAYIGESVEIGEGCYIGANTVIECGVVLGDGGYVSSNVTISHALVGENVRIHPGVRIGQDGFGFAIDPAGHVKVPQLGRVVIGNHVEIGSNTTIDRGAGPDTVIGDGTWIDNLVQIAHNVKIGRGCVIVAQAGIAGSTVIEDFVAIGGQAGISGHLRIGQGARIGGNAGVIRNVEAGAEQMGYPAVPLKDFLKQAKALNRLIHMKKDA